MTLKYEVEVAYIRWERRTRQLALWYPFFAEEGSAPVDWRGRVWGDSDSEDEDLEPGEPNHDRSFWEGPVDEYE